MIKNACVKKFHEMEMKRKKKHLRLNTHPSRRVRNLLLIGLSITCHFAENSQPPLAAASIRQLLIQSL